MNIYLLEITSGHPVKDVVKGPALKGFWYGRVYHSLAYSTFPCTF